MHLLERLQNKEGLTLAGIFMEGTTLTYLERYFDAKKRTLSDIVSGVAFMVKTIKGVGSEG